MSSPILKEKKPGINSLLKPYKGLIFLLISLALLSNGINLILPKLIAHGIDSYTHGTFDVFKIVTWFLVATVSIFVFSYLQGFVQIYASEKVARDLRTKLTHIISNQSFSFVEKITPAKLLTNITSDIDTIKMYISQALVSIISSLFIIIGSSILLISINWKLGLVVMLAIPIIAFMFAFVLKKVRAIFMASRAVMDTLNKIITESILGSALIRILNSQQLEYDKFVQTSTKARDFGFTYIRHFAVLIPVITLTANMANLSILLLGGHFVIAGTMSIGDFTAFNSYLALMIFPIILIGIMSTVIAQATASYQRITEIINAPLPLHEGKIKKDLTGEIALKNVSLTYNQKKVLKNISFNIEPGSRTAIIGPTAAGKTQLLQLLTGLTTPTSGEITFDGENITDFSSDNFYQQTGLVFQNSIVFNMGMRENIAFNQNVSNDSLQKAIETAVLNDFIDSLPDRLDTVISERGTSLSGGQKQRIMLARALAIDPKILFLDDFTARVDNLTESKILELVKVNYPDTTLVSITQKVASVQDYDQIILLMEGEVLATGKHEALMKNSPEYVQIFKSQQSTSNYEL